MHLDVIDDVRRAVVNDVRIGWLHLSIYDLKPRSHQNPLVVGRMQPRPTHDERRYGIESECFERCWGEIRRVRWSADHRARLLEGAMDGHEDPSEPAGGRRP